jgi:hypothetical protein
MKRKIAIILSVVTVLGTSVCAFADTQPTTVAADATSTGAGTLDVVKSDVYSVVVPTTPKLDYIVDPQGLAGMANGSTADMKDLSGGNVYSSSSVDIINKSSNPVTVTTTVTAGTATGVTVADTLSTSPTGAELVLAVVPSEGTVEFSEDGSSQTVKVATTGTTGYSIGTSGAKVPVVLAAADYEVKKDESGTATFGIKSKSAGGAVSLAVAGKCSTDSTKWFGSDSAKIATPSLTVTYSFTEPTDAEKTSLGTAKYALGTPTGSAVTDLKVSAATAPSFTGGAYTVGQDFVISYTKGTDSKAIADTNPITKVEVIDDATSAVTDVTGNANFVALGDGTITIKSGLTQYITASSTVKVTYALASGDTDTATVAMTVAAAQD